MSVRIVFVSGPNRGATYFLEEGETSFGRTPENTVVLASPQVSKRHCALVCHSGKVEMRDLGSSNGTFVNGVLSKKRLLQNKDRVSLGPFVLEVVMPELPVPRDAFAHLHASQGPGTAHVSPISIDPGSFKVEQEPTSLIGKYKKKFDDLVMPVVYDFYERTDYPTLLTIIFGIFVLLNLGFTVYPVLQRSREEVVRQAEHQALYISNQVAYLNRQAILEGKEGSLVTDFAESEVNVDDVTLTNLEGRILAPGSRLNETFDNSHFLKYRDLLLKNQSAWGKPRTIRLADKEQIIAFTPVMVLSKTKGINVPGAISTVIYSTKSIALDAGTVGTVYLEALFWSLLLGAVFLYVVFHLTHRPIEKLSDDMDKVLKGEGHAVEKKYKNDAIDQLIDTVNAALGRIPRAEGQSGDMNASGGAEQERMIIDNMLRSMEFFMQKSSSPAMLLDAEMRIRFLNGPFEEMSGIRNGQGELIDTVSRDESFPSLLKEMAENAKSAGNEGVQEDYDFPVGQHQVSVIALQGVPGTTDAFLFLFEKKEG